ncbi:MAG: trypsin-like peptidase domain-containing protein [Patescibacteria group bacterium]|nr:trypsin-like peptidase domain-containing protein [Patescibacteria group bacterium]MDE2438145.1 trypsin-like peptidase domain-containing protein [Patescibacteria group bacterium]
MEEQSPLINVVKSAMPAVVSIVISKDLRELEKEIYTQMYPYIPQGEEQPHISPEDVDEKGMVKIGGGSGFVVDPSGIILTNRHVVSEPNASYAVLTDDNKTYAATILARDPINDVAILKIDAHDLPTLTLGDSARITLGQQAIAIGNALGMFKNTVSSGIVSGIARHIPAQIEPGEKPTEELRGLIQTDTAINPGNSGGPLLNIFGEVMGINTAIIFGAQNIGFALPINAAKKDLADLKEFGRIRKPLLGIKYVILDDALQRHFKLPVNYGALVVRQDPGDNAIVPHSPASKAGIKEQDVILECNEEKVTRDLTLQDMLDRYEVGDELMLKVLRNGKEITAAVKLVERK